jgi:Zn-dependent protease with chaperone function
MSNLLQSGISAMSAGQGMDLLAFALAPVAAAALVRATVLFLGKAVTVSRVEVWLARAAAATPGIVFLGLEPLVFRSAHAQPGPTLLCILHCYGLPAVYAAVLIAAIIIFGRECSKSRRLLKLTEAPSKRNTKLAKELGIRLRELPTQFPACFVAGLWRPVVVISQGTLASLSARELRAALMHERAHCRRRETWWAAALWFLNGATFVPVRSAFDAYKRASEFATDREAAREVHSLTLASALVAVARARVECPLLAGLAGEDNLRDRVALLVGGGVAQKASCARESLGFLSLTGAASLPVVAGMMHGFVHLVCQ